MMQFRAAKALSPAHPQRLCNRIADQIAADCLARDPAARVDCRIQLAQKEVLVFGELASLRQPKVSESAAAVLAEAGLGPADYSIATALHQRAPEIETRDCSCIVSGYAEDETPQVLAERLSRRLDSAGEVLVTIEYDEDGGPLRVEQISVAAEQNDRFIHNPLKSIEQALQGFPHDENSKLSLTILPSEPQFQVTVSEPMHGKSPDNLERSAGLMARYIAKNLAAAKLVKRCQVTLAYAVGVDAPVMVTVDSFGAGEICADDCLAEAAKQVFMLEKQKLVSWIKLSYPSCSWERTDKAKALRDAVI